MARHGRRGGLGLAIVVFGALAARAQTTVPGGTIATDTTWTVAGSPYTVTGILAVVGTDGADAITTLTIQPGVEVRFNAGIQLQIGGNVAGSPGRLVADGNAAGGPAQIRFTSSSGSPSAGAWNGIYFRAGTRPSTLRNARIDYAGGGTWAGVYLGNGSGSSVTLEQLLVQQSGGYGIYQNGPATMTGITVAGSTDNAIRFASSAVALDGCDLNSGSTFDIHLQDAASVVGSIANCTAIHDVFYAGNAPAVTWSNNTFPVWGTRTSRIEPDAFSDLAADNVIQPIAGARLEITGGTVANDATWTAALGKPLVILGLIDVEGTSGADGITTLTIAPGLELRFGAGHQLRVGGTSSVPGALVADGDAAGGPAEILFTSSAVSPSPGAWSGLYFRAGTRPSTLRNARIDYAGGGTWAGVYLGNGAGSSVTLEQLLVQQSGNYGIYQNGPATMTGITVSGSTDNAIRFASSAVALDGCTLDSGSTFDIHLQNAASVVGTIANCTAIHDVFYGGNAPAVTWSNNTFPAWGTRTSRIEPDAFSDLAADNVIQPIAGARLEITGGTVANDATWTAALGKPLVILGLIDVEGTSGADGITTLTIAPGLELRWGAGHQLRIGGTSSVPGALVADGDAAGGPEEILFTSSVVSPSAGAWNGLYFRPGATPSLLRHARIDYAGGGSWAGVYLGHGPVHTMTLQNVVVNQSGNYGIYQGGPASISGLVVNGSADNALRLASDSVAVNGCSLSSLNSFDLYLHNASTLVGSVSNCASIGSLFISGSSSAVTFAGNTFVNWGARTSRLSPESVADLLADNTIQSVPGATVEITSGTVASDATWTSVLGHPYVVLGLVEVMGTSGADGVTTLTLAPGMELRFGSGHQLRIGGSSGASPGALIADGDAAGGPATIVFTSSLPSPAPGSWSGIYLRPGARASLFRRAVVDYAGGGSWAGIYDDHGTGTLTLDTVTIRRSAAEGLLAVGAERVITGSTFEQNGSHDITFLNVVSTGTVSSSTLRSVHYQGTNPTVTWSGNVFESWGSRTSRLAVQDVDGFSRNNTFNTVPNPVTEITGATLAVDASWGPGPGPFAMINSLTVQGTAGPDGRTTLQLLPGVSLRFPPSQRLIVGGASGAPGELVADGLRPDQTIRAVVLTTSDPAPDVGDWVGVEVRETGRATLREASIRWASTGLHVDGTLDRLEGVEVSRTNVGVDLDAASVLPVVQRLSLRNNPIALRASATAFTIRDSNLEGSTWGIQNLTPATSCVDAQFNWWGSATGPQGAAPVAGCETQDASGSGSPITEGVLFAGFQTAPVDDGDPVPGDDGDGVVDPCTGGNAVGCDDNCPLVANASQDDEDGDGVGDACDIDPVFRVSSDPADGADFERIQDAADASIQSGTRIEIYPGVGPYFESIRLDRTQTYTLAGIDDGTGDPVVIDGGAGVAVRIVNKAGTVPVRLRDLTFRGFQGVRTAVDSEIADASFEDVGAEAMTFDAGIHLVERIAVAPGAAVGARTAAGSTLTLRRAIVTGATDAGVATSGNVALENVVLSGGNGADGVRFEAPASLVARFVTIAGNTGVGIDATPGGSVTVDRSIVYGNVLGELVNVGCGGLVFTLGPPACAGANGNLSANPLLDAAFRPQAGSPCLDHGPTPATFTGAPPTDVDGGPRLLDHDGDGLSVSDCGAYEMPALSPVPGEVLGLRFDTEVRLLWDVEPSAAQYHVYRDLRSNLSYASFGVCRDDLDANQLDTQLDDFENPAAGAVFVYLVSAESGAGVEGTLGYASAAERSNFAPCP